MPKVGKKRKSAAQRSAHQGIWHLNGRMRPEKHPANFPQEKGDNQQSQPAGIMNLSTELRFQILQDLVPEDCVLEIHSLPEKRERTSTSRLPAEARLFMGLRLVNRAFYEEASTLFYTRNRFCISNGKYGSTKWVKVFLVVSPSLNEILKDREYPSVAELHRLYSLSTHRPNPPPRNATLSTRTWLYKYI